MGKDKTIAKLSITGAPGMKMGRRRQIIAWLRRNARLLEKDKLSGRYSARFIIHA